jgi:uncharacterized membrane protein (UPF0136 family)
MACPPILKGIVLKQGLRTETAFFFAEILLALSLSRAIEQVMTHSRWLILFGAFLFVCGLAGYLSNPAAAKTALISGSLFGGLSVIWGLLLAKGLGFVRWAALAMTVMLCGVFSWRSFASWQAVADGAPKTFAASLITLMLLGSLATVVKLLRSSGHHSQRLSR